MTEALCETCGARNAPTAQFCQRCDSYLGWDRGSGTLGGEPLTRTIPPVVDSVLTEESVDVTAPPEPVRRPVTRPGDERRVGPARPATGSGTAVRPEESASRPGTGDDRSAKAPTVTAASSETTLGADGTATISLTVYNASAIVDGFRVDADVAPSWLSLSQDEARVMPGQGRTITVTLVTRPGVMVFAQRFRLRLLVRSETDPTKVAEVPVSVTVPPWGPPATLAARPNLVRLTDATQGACSLHLDNRSANYPQLFRLAGSDPEGVVRFAFEPAMVEVPPGQVVEAAVRFAAPPPEADRELNRQLTITAANDQGTVTTMVTLVQRTSPAPVHVPVRIRLEPSHLRLTNTGDAELDVMIDNRGSRQPSSVQLGGRDPEHALGFFFLPQRVIAAPGQVTSVRARVRAPLPPPGQSVQRPFTIMASDGVTESEAAGTLELSRTAPPITTAALQVHPRQLVAKDSRRGTFRVDVDNARGLEELRVRLDGSEDSGSAALTFAPAMLAVPAGAVGSARLTVHAPQPPMGQRAERSLLITATDGVGSLEARASLTQVNSDRRALLRILLVLIGAFLVAVGALAAWIPQAGTFLPSLAWVDLVTRTSPSSIDAIGAQVLGQPPLRALVILLAVLLVLGLNGRAGGLIRRAAMLVVLLTVAYVVATMMTIGGAIDLGLVVVWLGAVLAYIGGVLARVQAR